MSKLLFSLFFLLTVACGSAFAAPPLPEQAEIYVGEMNPTDLSHLPKSTQPAPSVDMQKNLAVGTTGIAPPLTYLQIVGVYSTNYPSWEPIADSQTITVQDHGGSLLRVVTQELGYGNIPVARMNGTLLPGTANYAIRSICQDAYGNYYIPCLSGQIVVGFEKYWKLDGYQGGQFTYQNTSSNSPWNTMRDSLTIR